MKRIDDWKHTDGSEALKNLQIATGNRPAGLAGLSPSELQDFLSSLIYGLDSRKLRGFQELEDCFTYRSGEFSCAPAKDLRVASVGLTEPMTMKSGVSHLLPMPFEDVMVWKNLSSGDEASDPGVHKTWDNCQLVGLRRKYLMLNQGGKKRPPSDETVVVVSQRLKRVKFDKRFEIHDIECHALGMSNFSALFGSKSVEVAYGLILGLRDILDRTSREIHEEAKAIAKQADEMQRLANTVSN